MRIGRKIFQFVLYMLPFMFIVCYAINMCSDGVTFNVTDFNNVIDQTVSMFDGSSNVLSDTIDNIVTLFAPYVPIQSVYIEIIFNYLCYLFVCDIVIMIFDLLSFVPRKCSELFNRG